MLARQDRSKPSVHNDRYRVRDACLAAERRYGLRPTAPADRTAPRSPSRGEKEKAAGRGLGEAPRVTLRRHVATPPPRRAARRSSSLGWRRPECWSASGTAPGIPARSPGTRSRCPATPARRGPVWYGGGKLAADLTWPRLRQRWAGLPGPAGAEPLTAADRNAVWEHAAQVAAEAAAQIRALAGTSPAAAADAAWAASDTLHAAAAVLGSDGLRQAADAFDRAARAQYGRIPAPSPAGAGLRQAARLISACAYLARDPARTWLVLIARLAALADAVAELREIQQRAAQAAAARTAARHLHAAARPAPAGRPARQHGGPAGRAVVPRPARVQGSRPRAPAPGGPPGHGRGPAARGQRPGRHLPGPAAPAGDRRPGGRAWSGGLDIGEIQGQGSWLPAHLGARNTAGGAPACELRAGPGRGPAGGVCCRWRAIPLAVSVWPG